MLYSVDDKTYDAFFQAVLCGVNPLSGASGQHPQDEAKAILPGIAKLWATRNDKELVNKAWGMASSLDKTSPNYDKDLIAALTKYIEYIGAEEGVDHQIDAYVAGVPLEDILLN